MNTRYALCLLLLAAALMAPFGRAQAQSADHAASAMTAMGHCEPARPGDPAPAHHGSIDCMVLCAAMPAHEAGVTAPQPRPLAILVASPAARLTGILPKFDPPPPRAVS